MTRTLLALLTILGVGCASAPAPDDDDDASFVCPVEPVATDCDECMEEKCADLFAFCDDDPRCACLRACITDGGIPAIDSCMTTLGLTSRPPGFDQIEECAAFACPDGDECNTPDDWEPPDQDLVCDEAGSGPLSTGALADCGFDGTLPSEPEGAVLQLVSEDGLCVKVERTDQGPGSLKNTSWRLDRFTVGEPGSVVQIDSAADLAWYSSHHNFRDWAHAWSGDRHYDLVLKEDGHGGPRRYHLYVFEDGPITDVAPSAEGESCIAGPLVLSPAP